MSAPDDARKLRADIELEKLASKLLAAWKALGVDPLEAADDPDTAELADSIRVSLQHERDERERLREILQAQLDAANARAERADGQFRAADLELNRLKVELGQARMALEDLRSAKCFWCGLVPPTPGERTH